eukprot:gene20118-22089_t
MSTWKDEDCRKGWSTLAHEYSYWVPHVDIEGQIPHDLQGTFFRNGPGLSEVYGKRLKHPIDGDGMICALTIIDGQVHFKSKFVLSPHRLEEEKEKKFIYRGQMGTANKQPVKDTIKALSALVTGSKLSLNFRNPSNTNVFYWGGKLLSCYETSMPICLDPHNLETLGIDNLNGNLELSCLGAHFRVDAVNDRLVCFSQRPGVGTLPKLAIYEFNQDWSLHRKQTCSIEGLNYVHDFALLPDYYLVHITPFVKISAVSGFAIAAGWSSPGETMRYFKDQPSKLVLVPRDPARKDQIVTVNTGAYHMYHYGTAEQIGNCVQFVAPCYEEKFKMDFENGMWLSNASVAPGKLRQFTINIDEKTCVDKVVDEASCEFISIHPYRHGFQGTNFNYLMANDRQGQNVPFRDVIKYDTATGSRQVWHSEGIIGEPCFVPRFGYESRDRGCEDDGYVLVQLYHPKKHVTSFCVLDATDVGKGCIAKINLKHHVPYGFHGTFSPEVFINPGTLLVKSKL